MEEITAIANANKPHLTRESFRYSTPAKKDNTNKSQFRMRKSSMNTYAVAAAAAASNPQVGAVAAQKQQQQES